MTPDLNSKPRLAAGCRLNDKSSAPRMLLMPERALRLSGPSLDIVTRCDGRRTVAEIIAELQAVYSKAEPARVERDVLEYLALLHEKRALDFE
jgi:pyrroloquinoline quinone biosynthesis protein D